MRNQTVLGCLLACAALLGAGSAMAQRGAQQPVKAQLPPAPPLTETPVLEIKVE